MRNNNIITLCMLLCYINFINDKVLNTLSHHVQVIMLIVLTI